MKREWLMGLRNAKGLTQSEVAEIAGISRSYYTQIETGTRNPTGETALKISKALGFKMEYFFVRSVDNINRKNKEVI